MTLNLLNCSNKDILVEKDNIINELENKIIELKNTNEKINKERKLAQEDYFSISNKTKKQKTSLIK